MEPLPRIRVQDPADIMLLPDQLTSGSSTDLFIIEMDSNSFSLFETEPSIVVQPDLSLLIYNMNFQVRTREICCSIRLDNVL